MILHFYSAHWPQLTAIYLAIHESTLDSSKAPSAIGRDDDDDVIVNFRLAGVWTVQEWLYNITDTKIREFSMDSQI